MPFELFNEIEDDFRREKFDVSKSTNLDNWVAFYYKHGRFPGNSELTILPQSQIPKLIDPLSVEVSPIELYNKFKSGDAKALVSFQAVLALFLYHGGERIVAKRAIDEWKSNFMFQSLSKESDRHTMSFEKLGQVVYYFLRAFLTPEGEFEQSEQNKLELLETVIDSSASADFSIEEAPEIIATSTLKRSPIPRPPIPPSLLDSPKDMTDNESAYLKTALTMSETNLDASIEAVEEENRNVLREIVDPTSGLVTDDLFTRSDLNRAQNENEAKFKLGNAVQETLDKILNDITRNISWNKESESTIEFSQLPTDNREDFVIDIENKNIETEKTALQTKITTGKKKTNAIKKRSPYLLRKRKAMFLDSADTRFCTNRL